MPRLAHDGNQDLGSGGRNGVTSALGERQLGPSKEQRKVVRPVLQAGMAAQVP